LPSREWSAKVHRLRRHEQDQNKASIKPRLLAGFCFTISVYPFYNAFTMTRYDLCTVWNWEYDRDFVRMLETACVRMGLSFYSVTEENLDATLEGLSSRNISFGSFFDRACESDPRFQALVDKVRHSHVFCINPQELTVWSQDKATMHLEFVNRSLGTPNTILISSYDDLPSLPQLDLAPLGGRFAIKPASLGGGEGVVLEATSQEQVSFVRQQYPHEKYLLQAHVTPRMLEDRPGWFRVLVCSGGVYPCWWDPHTHVYARVTAEDRFRFGLHDLYEVARRIAQVCRLDLFSTEIALNSDGRFLAVDYVNDPVDLRLQSKAVDGVPDAWVESIAGRLVRLAERYGYR
jgi:glutathione synthase/RimK-type ligase-like ATP-grasp enzyme